MKSLSWMLLTASILSACGDKDTTDTGVEEADTDTDTDTDTSPDVTNLLQNPSFESGWDSNWLVYPSELGNFAVVTNGDSLYNNDAETFEAQEGMMGLKVYGRYGNVQLETPIYQEFMAVAGESYYMSAYARVYAGDELSAEHVFGMIQIKFFDDSYSYYGSADSASITSKNTGEDGWILLEVTGTVPKGATKAQAALEFYDCYGYKSKGECGYDYGGGVYFDDVVFGKITQ